METSPEVNASARNDSAESPVNKDAIRRIVLIVLSAFLFFGIAGIFSKNYLFNRHVQYVAGGSDVTEVKVLGVVMDSLSGSPAVFLHHESEDVYLPIWIGANEAVAIQAELSGVKSPRP
ncbi:bifunctional nuclease family protein, partial [bacterium]|nr:bifunctional nuclease family protein [bacterium]